MRDGLLNDAFKPRPEQIGREIDEYPATLVDLPDDAWAVSSFGQVVVEKDTWWVVVPLWSAEEGRSDLSMEAYVIDDGASVRVIVDNVHVL